MTEIDITMLFYFAVGLAAVYVVGWLLMFPLKKLLKLTFNSIIAAVIMTVLDMLGFGVDVTALNCIIVGALGIPGFILVWLYKML